VTKRELALVIGTAEDAMCLAKVTRGRRHDGPLREQKLQTSINGSAYVVLTDEIDGSLEADVVRGSASWGPGRSRR
jgi:hypothetical protein